MWVSRDWYVRTRNADSADSDWGVCKLGDDFFGPGPGLRYLRRVAVFVWLLAKDSARLGLSPRLV